MSYIVIVSSSTIPFQIVVKGSVDSTLSLDTNPGPDQIPVNSRDDRRQQISTGDFERVTNGGTFVLGANPPGQVSSPGNSVHSFKPYGWCVYISNAMYL